MEGNEQNRSVDDVVRRSMVKYSSIQDKTMSIVMTLRSNIPWNEGNYCC